MSITSVFGRRSQKSEVQGHFQLPIKATLSYASPCLAGKKGSKKKIVVHGGSRAEKTLSFWAGVDAAAEDLNMGGKAENSRNPSFPTCSS